tara:strand:+ start:85 stop:1110 length:1026 start_codon:yes stop_codon:yes gene_type:complete
MPSARAAFLMATNNYAGLKPTNLHQKDFIPLYKATKEQVLKDNPNVRINSPKLNRIVYEKIGYPHWDKSGAAGPEGQKGFAPYLMNGGKPRLADTRRASNGKAGKKRQSKETVVDKDVKSWANKLTKAKKWPPGKSLKDFQQKEKALETRHKNQVNKLTSKGVLVDDGHAYSLGNAQKVGTPLRPKGMGGSHSASARVVEPSAINQGKGAKADMSHLNAKRGGVANSAVDRFAQYLTDDRGTLAKPTKGDIARMMRGENPDKVIAQRDKANQRFKNDAVKVKPSAAKATAPKRITIKSRGGYGSNPRTKGARFGDFGQQNGYLRPVQKFQIPGTTLMLPMA